MPILLLDLCLHLCCQAEITQLNLQIVAQKDVLRLQVAMNIVFAVHISQCRENLSNDFSLLI